MIFELTENQLMRLKEWQEELCNQSILPYAGKRLSYVFAPGPIGLSVIVKCLTTNKTIDLTEYDKW